MVEDRITDGKRIAQLLASELDGREDDELSSVAVTNADRNVEATDEGARAYDVTVTAGVSPGSAIESGDDAASGNGNETASAGGDRDERLARVFVHPEYARLEFERGRTGALEAAAGAGPDVRVDADGSVAREGATSSGTGSDADTVTVYVESGAAVKRATTVVRAACQSVADGLEF